MNLEGLLTAIVGGVFTISILAVLFAPQSAAAGVINATGQQFASIVTSAKAYPK